MLRKLERFFKFIINYPPLLFYTLSTDFIIEHIAPMHCVLRIVKLMFFTRASTQSNSCLENLTPGSLDDSALVRTAFINKANASPEFAQEAV